MTDERDDSKVTLLHGEGGGDPRVEKLFYEKIEEAKTLLDGKIRAFAVVLVDGDGGVISLANQGNCRYTLIGGLETLKFRMYRDQGAFRDDWDD